MNPYRIFYSKQAQWHQIKDLDSLKNDHEIRAKYYRWYTKGWLPENKNEAILDIGCGAGQFVYFLNKESYTNITGIDIDIEQIKLAQQIGLNCHAVSVQEYLNNHGEFKTITMLDIIEHFTLSELFPLMDSVYKALAIGGQIIVSVPNATSPTGLSTQFSDITHENSFSPTSLSQFFFCHNLKIKEFRDPWPASISFKHNFFRNVILLGRKFESLRMKLIGLSAPKYWSPVIWAIAEKTKQTQ